MAEQEARPIPGEPSWDWEPESGFSPDGKSLLFWAGSTVLSSGSRLVADACYDLPGQESSFGATWNEQGIVFALWGKGILRVSPNGGQPRC